MSHFKKIKDPKNLHEATCLGHYGFDCWVRVHAIFTITKYTNCKSPQLKSEPNKRTGTFVFCLYE